MSFSEALGELLRQLVVTKLKGSLSSWNRGFFVIMICPVGVLCSDSVRKNSKRKKEDKMARGKKGSPGRDPKRYKGYFTQRDSSTGRLASSYRDRFRNISSEERVHRDYQRIMNEIYDRNRDSYPNVVEERREPIESLEI